MPNKIKINTKIVLKGKFFMKVQNVVCENPNCDHKGDITTTQPPYVPAEKIPCPKCNKLTLKEV